MKKTILFLVVLWITATAHTVTGEDELRFDFFFFDKQTEKKPRPPAATEEPRSAPAGKPVAQPAPKPKPAPKTQPAAVTKQTPKPKPQLAPEVKPDAPAADMSLTPGEYPLSGYTTEQLARVREWEKTWVGKRITKDTIGQVQQFLPEQFVAVFENPDTWGAPAEGFSFTIGPYRRIVETKGMIEATRNYTGQVKTDTNGIVLNYRDIAGIPFPQPQTGMQMAYNFDFNTHGDSAHYRRIVPNINPQSRTERISDQEQWELFFINRVDTDPRPSLPSNPRDIRRGIFMHMYRPPEFLNTRYYSLRYVDHNKSDDLYLWYSQFRRVRRMSTAQRTDAIDGTDLIYDDEFFWDGHINRNTYTYQGMRELLSTRHQDMRRAARRTGQALFNGLTFERCNLLIVEAVNKDPTYVYSKRVWYLDPETYLILWTEIYDNLGRYWKCFIQHTNNVRTQNGELKNFIVGSTFLDIQRTHGGATAQNVLEISGGSVEPQMFTTGYLQRTY